MLGIIRSWRAGGRQPDRLAAKPVACNPIFWEDQFPRWPPEGDSAAVPSVGKHVFVRADARRAPPRLPRAADLGARAGAVVAGDFFRGPRI